jgi:hypothetical protein
MDMQQPAFKSGIYHIRRLREEEALLYKVMRLEAIQTEPAMFRCTTPAEADLTDEQWLERRKPDGSYVFDYFEKDHLGSVRVTLTEESTVVPYLVAGMEPQNASAEDLLLQHRGNPYKKTDGISGHR